MESKVKLFACQTITYAFWFPLSFFGFPRAAMDNLWMFSLSMKHHLPPLLLSALAGRFSNETLFSYVDSKS